MGWSKYERFKWGSGIDLAREEIQLLGLQAALLVQSFPIINSRIQDE